MSYARKRLSLLAALALVASMVTMLPAGAANEVYEYTFTFENGLTIMGSSGSNVAFLPNAGGTSVDNPTGMDVHVSCSDEFPSGWGEKDGPEEGVDTAWRLVSYSITKYKDGNVDKTCSGDDLIPPDGIPSNGDAWTYEFNFANGQTVTGTATNQDAFIPDAGGTDANNPTGMIVHLSCSDEFPGGWGDKQGPDEVDDSAWQLSSYSITKYKDGQIDKTCSGDDLIPPDGIPSNGEAFVYEFNFVNGQTVTGTATNKDALIPDAGGTDANNPTGMIVHLSCSDEFPGGWGDKQGPDEVDDSAWQLSSYSITKYKDGQIDKVCSGTPVPGPPPEPAIDLEKLVNGVDADEPTGPEVSVGDTVLIEYIVTNTGDVTLNEIVVTDADLGIIGCPVTTLAPGASMDCDSQTVEVTAPGQVFMEADVEGTALVEGLPATPAPSGSGTEYTFAFNFVNGQTVTGISDNNAPFVPGVGGTSVEQPTGVVMHVSCSDKFPGGWGEKDGPVEGVDTAWQIASYSIIKYKDGVVEKTCNDSFFPTEQQVTDNDPIHYFGVEAKVPDVDIEKSVNGRDADNPPGPTFDEGGTLVFDYVVTNTGEVTLTDIVVTDDTLGAVTCPLTTLEPGESMDCDPEFEIAVPGTFVMTSTVDAIGEGQPVTDTDPVNFVVEPVKVPDVDIEKSVNGFDADDAPGPEFGLGALLTFDYVVTNTGEVTLTDIVVTDSTLGAVTCPLTTLEPGESMACAPHTEVAKKTGAFTMQGIVDATGDGQAVSDADPVNFTVSDKYSA